MNASRKKLLILGFGGHARSVGDIALECGYEELIFLDDYAKSGENFHGFRVLQKLHVPLDSQWKIFPASGNADIRLQQLKIAEAMQMPIATLISPLAQIRTGATIAAGVLIAHNAYVGPLVTINTGAIVNTGAVVDHEASVGEFAHVSINSTMAGRSKIGARSMLGASATVIDKVFIGNDIVIGAGAVVVSDLNEPGTYVGVPARKTIKNTEIVD